MAVKLCPLFNGQQETAAGVPAVGTLLYTYAAGSSTLQSTYTSSTGLVAQTNPVEFDSLGFPTGGEIWLTSGLTYKLVWKTAAGVTLKTVDNVSGVNDTSTTTSQWQTSGVTPTYVSTTSFTLAGDQTSEFHVNRRLQFTVTAGTVYGTITGSVFGALTTVTVAMDTGQALDSGLSAVSLSILRADRTAIPFPFNTLLRNHLAGLTMSTAGSSATMSIAAGQAVDSTNLYLMALASAISKTTSAWAVGTAAGGLDTGAIANSTWYHFYLIKRLDTSVVDIVFSTNATTPTLPANYTVYRRIGSGLTNGSAQWTKFIQNGDTFTWDVYVADVQAVNPGSSAVLRQLTVPTNVKVQAQIFTLLNAADIALISDPAVSDQAVTANVGTMSASGGNGGAESYCWTDTSRQVRTRMNSGAAVTLRVTTIGWVDRRGKDA